MKYFLTYIILFTSAICFGQNLLSVTLEKVDATCIKGSTAILISGGQGPYHIYWSTGDSSKLSLVNLNVGNYSVQVKDKLTGDTTIAFAIRQHECDVLISNHFTPNGDGFNDTWSISNAFKYPDFELFVFNRSGQTVYHQIGTYTPWDGKSFGIDVLDATYYYVFYFDKSIKSRFLKGDVSILR